MRKTKRRAALFMVTALLATLLMSCGQVANESQSAPDSEKASDSYTFPENIASEDFGGEEFTILTFGETGGEHWSAFEFIFDSSLEGDVLNDAVNTRDRLFEEKFNVKVKYLVQELSTIGDFARNTILSGSDDFDVSAISIRDSATLAGEGLFYNLYEFDDILNLDEEWWDKNAAKQLSVKNRLYFTPSTLTLVDKQAMWVIYFTKSMVEKYQLCPDEDNGLYSLVEKGEWTIDKLYEMIKAVGADSDGDGEMTDADTYGECGGTFVAASLMAGCGSHVTEKDADDVPKYVWLDQVDNLVEDYEMVYDIVNNTDTSITTAKMISLGYDEPYIAGFGSLMEDGRLLFNITGMNRCRLYRNLECNFGILPMPKRNKDQKEYYSIMSQGYANCVGIPISGKDPETTAKMLEAFTCLAYQTTYEAYIEKALTYKYLRDDDSADMLKIIFEGRQLDPVDVYNLGGGNMSVFDASLNPTGLASSIKQVSKLTEKSIERFIKQFDSIAEKTGRE